METLEPGEPAPRRRPSEWMAPLLGALAVVVLVASVLVLGNQDDGSPAAPKPPEKTAAAGRERIEPKRWDPRLGDLVAFVEQARGLTFEHPVRTEFLHDEAFRAEVTVEEDLGKDDRASLEHVAGLFRALGLVAGELDLRDATNQLSEEIVGLYDPVKDRILVRGTEVLPAMRPTIVHELTHALQAQHHDLERDHRTSGEETAFKALVEADALRVQDAYVASLPPPEQEELRGSANAAVAAAGAAIDVPPILTELTSLPYVLGPPFLAAASAAKGEGGLEAVFAAPPTAEEHLVDPQTYLAGELPARVVTPRLTKGEKAVGEADDFGMLSLLLVLGERIPFHQAWAAAVGWKGDSSVGYQVGGKDCIRIRTLLDSEGDANELRDAVVAWGVGREVEVGLGANPAVVNFSSCDPGLAAAGTDPARPRTFELLLLRTELLRSLSAQGLDGPTAACVADAILRERDPALLLQAGANPQDERLVDLQRFVEGRREECRPG